jgi:hypothetical protein
VDTPVPWQRAGSPITLDMKAVPGISLVYDALFVALTHAPAAGRRHLIVAMTDGRDCGSLLDGERMLDASGRSEAVLHWIYVSSQGDFNDQSVGAWCTPTDYGEVDYVEQTATRTGGDKHRSRFGDPAVRTFAQILDEFRQSYVLRYSPEGVKPKRLACGRRAGPGAACTHDQVTLGLFRLLAITNRSQSPIVHNRQSFDPQSSIPPGPFLALTVAEVSDGLIEEARRPT